MRANCLVLAAAALALAASPISAREPTAAAQSEEHLAADASLPLETWVHLPEATSRPRALVLALHGFGASAADMAQMHPAFTPSGITLAAAEAPYEFERPDRAGRDWDLSHTRDPERIAAARETTIEAVRGTLAALRERYRPRTVWLLGFSQGGRIAYRTLLSADLDVDGVIVIASGLDADTATMTPASKRRPPVLIGHGMSDATVPIERGLAARDRLDALGYPVTFFSFGEGHGIPPATARRIVDWILDRTR